MATIKRRKHLRLAVAGLGTIGLEVARRVDKGCIEGIVLTAAASGNEVKARERLADFRNPPSVMALADLADVADVILESAPAPLFRDVAEPAISGGCIFMPLSAGALLDNLDLIEVASKTGAQIIVPTGALIGLDAVRAVAQGEIESVTMVTRKPPDGLSGAPYLVDRGISLDSITHAQLLFSGSAREAVKGFPANLNVSAALALAGVGADRTIVEIWADPDVTRNTHTITVLSDSSNFTVTIENSPTQENPRTGKITALSVIATLKRLTEPLVVGS
jgi:aspartate dehydrogenase